jgi:CofD-related protein of GAK system
VTKVQLTKCVSLPDLKAVERYRKVPELGPAILFFSGGSALKRVSRKLIEYTHNSIHIITPFDSGGSSAILRKEFGMLSIGDIRNRIMALADQSYTGNPEIYKLFAYRFPKDVTNADLQKRMQEMIDGKHPLVAAVIDPLRKIIRNHLQYFADGASSSFDLRGASIGNVILTGGYLNNRHQIDPVIYLFSKLVEARGTVRPVLNCDYQLAARLSTGEVIVGQHLITAKETEPLKSKIEELYLVKSFSDHSRVNPEIRDKMKSLIRQAELICYPPGSFYSSVISNFLPGGVADAIAASPAIKVYIPNLGNDPEQTGIDIKGSVNILIEYLQRGCAAAADVAKLLNFVIIDSEHLDSELLIKLRTVEEFGIQVLDTRLADKEHPDLHDPQKVAEVLLSLT